MDFDLVTVGNEEPEDNDWGDEDSVDFGVKGKAGGEGGEEK